MQLSQRLMGFTLAIDQKDTIEQIATLTLTRSGLAQHAEKIHLGIILLAIVDPGGKRKTFYRTLLDADFGPVGPKSASSKAVGAYSRLSFRPKKPGLV